MLTYLFLSMCKICEHSSLCSKVYRVVYCAGGFRRLMLSCTCTINLDIVDVYISYLSYEFIITSIFCNIITCVCGFAFPVCKHVHD